MKLIHMLRKHLHISTKTVIYGEMLALSLLCLSIFLYRTDSGQAVMSQRPDWPEPSIPWKTPTARARETGGKEKEYIKWVDFAVTSEAMNQAFRYDVDTCQAEIHLNWVDLLAYLGARYGGDFSKYKPEHMKTVAEKLKTGETTMADLTKDMKYYTYYRMPTARCWTGWWGQFQAEIPASEAPAAYLPSGVAGGAPGESCHRMGDQIWAESIFPYCQRISLQ